MSELTDKEILQRAIEKAEENGLVLDSAFPELPHESWNAYVYDETYHFIIFSHEFAKAFWGDEVKENEVVNGRIVREYRIIKWKYHLTKMVLEEEPLQYLAKFL